MIEKLIDLFKLFLERCLYKSLIAVALVLTTIMFLPEENDFLQKLSAIEIRVFLFVSYFVILSIIEFSFKKLWKICVDKYEKLKQDKIDKEIEEKEIAERLKQYESTKREVKNVIVNMSECDKRILVEFIKSGNEPQEIEDRTYDGELFYAGYNFTEVIKKYAKPIEISNREPRDGVVYFNNLEEDYTQFKLTKVFYEMIVDIYQNEGQSYFEWE